MLAKENDKKCRPHTLTAIIKQVTKKRSVPVYCVTPSAICKRVFRGLEFLAYGSTQRLTLPLIEIESSILKVVLQMARLRGSLSISQAIQLVNNVINNNNRERRLVEFKRKYCRMALLEIWVGYGCGFMKRNKDKLVNSVGKNYCLTRNNWTTSRNFKAMYENIIHEMVEEKVAEKLDVPEWQDEKGQSCIEENAFGCKVTHKIVRPDMCIVGDEVGGNLSMKGDDGRKKILCAQGQVPREKASGIDRHFTTIGLTTLSGEALMCIVIMKGKRVWQDVELGIDPFAKII